MLIVDFSTDYMGMIKMAQQLPPQEQLSEGQQFLQMLNEVPPAPMPDEFTKAQIQAESNWNPFAVSPRGAKGLMQLMPGTAAWMATKLGIKNPNLHDPEVNLKLGTEYMKYLRDKYGRDDLALAAYNWGEGHLDKLMKKRPGQELLRFTPRETQRYVKQVLGKISWKPKPTVP